MKGKPDLRVPTNKGRKTQDLMKWKEDKCCPECKGFPCRPWCSGKVKGNMEIDKETKVFDASRNIFKTYGEIMGKFKESGEQATMVVFDGDKLTTLHNKPIAGIKI